MDFLIKKFFIPTGRQSMIYLLGLMVFFWSMFDATISYVTPIFIDSNGFSKTIMGIIIATSSVTGLIFDFLMCKVFKNTKFRRVFLLMFAICALYPIILWKSNTPLQFILAMALWGIYFDLYGYGTFNFIGHYTKQKSYAQNFGIIQIFRALACLIAPIIAIFAINLFTLKKIIYLSWFYLLLAFILFLVLFLSANKNSGFVKDEDKKIKRSLFAEFKLWLKLFKHIKPALLITFYIFTAEAFFWTLAPLYSEAGIFSWRELLLTSYTLPAILVGWLVSLFNAVSVLKCNYFGGRIKR